MSEGNYSDEWDAAPSKQTKGKPSQAVGGKTDKKLTNN